MPLFVCDECNSVDNTATSHYWQSHMAGTPALCSACDPKSGRWHDIFERETWDGKRPMHNRRDGNEAESERVPPSPDS